MKRKTLNTEEPRCPTEAELEDLRKAMHESSKLVREGLRGRGALQTFSCKLHNTSHKTNKVVS